MVSSKHKPPMADYITKLLLLETVRCAKDKDADGLNWINRVLYNLTLRWNATKRPRN